MKHRAAMDSMLQQRIRARLENTGLARGEAFFPAIAKRLAQTRGTRVALRRTSRG
jgi:hypothetical protein